jgi:type II restriction/modification system DNA methylase subunit YeeA
MEQNTPDAFITKWKASSLKERSAAQEHFCDLCRLLDEPTPAQADPDGSWYCFERGATKTTGSEGWADVWKRGHFAWEYKGKRKDLTAAFSQLQQYALALENPPLLVVSDMERFKVHTNWTNSISQVHEFALEDLRDANVRQKLKWVLSDPEKLRPSQTRQGLTEVAAGEFAELAKRLRERGHEAQQVAHFINRMVFCMFAEDVQLLPNEMFRRMLEAALRDPSDFERLASTLFAAMKDGGGVGFEKVDWFNGGLFDDDTALPLDKPDIELTLKAAKRDWSEIDPSIFGTLFERGLDPDKRSQLGAHYTDRDKIMMLVEPVVVRPWREEWEKTRETIREATEKADKAKSKAQRTKLLNKAEEAYRGFLDRLRAFRVLDPACGSGNFLYLSLQALKDLEHRAGLDAETFGVAREFPAVGPQQVKGIELNPFAAELARVTIWIGEIQWMRRNGFDVSKRPILKPLDTIECRDAILAPDGSEPKWLEADAIIGNPPFLGGKLLRDYLGDDYVDAMFRLYRGRVPAEADLVCYWFAKAWGLIENGQVQRVGLVATNSLRGGFNRRVLEPVVKNGTIYEAWDDEPWVVEGASVRVSLVCFSKQSPDGRVSLDGAPVTSIYSDLSTGSIDVTRAKPLAENRGLAFQGPVKVGPFEVPGAKAREWLSQPRNPDGSSNEDVLRPWVNGRDIVQRPSGLWIVDFGNRTEQQAAFYEGPFEYVKQHVKPLRSKNRDRQRREYWWRLGRSGADLKAATDHLSRFLATPRVSKHRIFVWAPKRTVPDSRLVVVARDDDFTFGVLHSRFHERWSTRLGGWHGVGNDPQYTPSLGFETFPFPAGLTPDIPASDYASDPRAQAIAEAAQKLNEQRETWLNPPDLVKREPEVVEGYPDRIVPVDEKAEKELKKRTLTKLYNERPTWLENAHRELDRAVAAAYGWPEDISDEDALARLMKLNEERRQGRAASADGLAAE